MDKRSAMVGENKKRIEEKHKVKVEVACLPQKEITCPMCQVQEGREVIMDYIKKYDFWKCPSCYVEVWVDNDRIKATYTQKKTEELLIQLNKQARWAVGGRFTEVKSLVPEISRKKSGGSRVGKRKKKPKKDRALWHLE